MNDRRVGRTRQLLQNALIELINERGYDSITVQDIVDRANVGRTTFYLHFTSKDELFLSCHEVAVSEFHFRSLSREELLSPHPPPGLIALYQHLQEMRGLLYTILQGKNSAIILQSIRNLSVKEIEDSLHASFPEANSAVPFNLLANYLAGAQIALLQWWLDRRQPYSAEYLAQMFHRLQRAAICDSLGLHD